MACAFGMEACKHYYTVRYIRMPDLLNELKIAIESINPDRDISIREVYELYPKLAQ